MDRHSARSRRRAENAVNRTPGFIAGSSAEGSMRMSERLVMIIRAFVGITCGVLLLDTLSTVNRKSCPTYDGRVVPGRLR